MIIMRHEENLLSDEAVIYLDCGSDYITKVIEMYIKNGGERINIYKLYIN